MYSIDELRKLGTTPRFHGNGFIQLYLSENERLHVWHPDFPATVVNGQIHDHKFELLSTVLLGCLNHVTYQVENDFSANNGRVPSHARPYDVHISRQDGNKSLRPVLHENSPVLAWVTGAYQFTRGSSYIFGKGEFHESSADELTVTRILRRNVGGYPKVLVRTREKLDHAFGEDRYTEEELWGAIEDGVTKVSLAEMMYSDHG